MISNKTNRGFTLIETLIAIMVLMLAIVGPLTLASKGLQSTMVSKDQETAFFLAQDAMEYVRWARDTNKLNSISWLAGLDGSSNGHTTNNASGAAGDCVSSDGSQSCLVDSLKDYVTSCAGATCSTPVYYDETANYFLTTSSNGTHVVKPTPFTRTVRIVTPVGVNDCTAGHGCEAAVTVLVSWSGQASVQRKVTIVESIFDWQ